MSGSRPKRGLADFLSRELKAPPPAVTEPEVRHSDTSEVREKKAPTKAHEPAILAPEPKAHAPAVPEPVVKAPEAKAPEAKAPVAISEPVLHASAAHAPKAPEPVVSAVREEFAETSPATDLAESRSARVSKSRTSEVRETAHAERSEPLYLRLTRKDVRFRDEQLGALHALARRLSKARRGAKGERITDNTLVRVAVDLLLQHADELSGADEAALLESLRKLSRKRG